MSAKTEHKKIKAWVIVIQEHGGTDHKATVQTKAYPREKDAIRAACKYMETQLRGLFDDKKTVSSIDAAVAEESIDDQLDALNDIVGTVDKQLDGVYMRANVSCIHVEL